MPALFGTGGRAFRCRMSVQSVVRRQVILIVVMMIIVLIRMMMMLNVAATGRTVRRGGLVRQDAERLLLSGLIIYIVVIQI